MKQAKSLILLFIFSFFYTELFASSSSSSSHDSAVSKAHNEEGLFKTDLPGRERLVAPLACAVLGGLNFGKKGAACGFLCGAVDEALSHLALSEGKHLTLAFVGSNLT